MGIFVSLILMAVGAILAWAVHPASSGSVDVNTVGYIVLVVGLIGLVLDLLLWESWGPGLVRSRRAVVTDADGVPAARRRTDVEEDEVV